MSVEQGSSQRDAAALSAKRGLIKAGELLESARNMYEQLTVPELEEMAEIFRDPRAAPR